MIREHEVPAWHRFCLKDGNREISIRHCIKKHFSRIIG